MDHMEISNQTKARHSFYSLDKRPEALVLLPRYQVSVSESSIHQGEIQPHISAKANLQRIGEISPAGIPSANLRIQVSLMLAQRPATVHSTNLSKEYHTSQFPPSNTKAACAASLHPVGGSGTGMLHSCLALFHIYRCALYNNVAHKCLLHLATAKTSLGVGT